MGWCTSLARITRWTAYLPSTSEREVNGCYERLSVAMPNIASYSSPVSDLYSKEIYFLDLTWHLNLRKLLSVCF
jgi:hypothetical protein